MSAFAVPIKRIRAIEPHPNADAIEFAVVEGYRSLVKKGEFRIGDLVAYIPEASLLPEWLLRRLGFWDADKGRGRLNGRDGNRVKAIRLRGELSQGICYALVPDTVDARRLRVESDETHAWPIVREGDDVAALLGIVKYDPPIPADLAGEVFDAGARLTVSFDVENWKSFPDVLRDGERVVCQ